jgi:hypothetical protein
LYSYLLNDFGFWTESNYAGPKGTVNLAKPGISQVAGTAPDRLVGWFEPAVSRRISGAKYLANIWQSIRVLHSIAQPREEGLFDRKCV